MTGIGLDSTKSNLYNSEFLECKALASFIFPFFTKEHILEIDLGVTFAATEITPFVPSSRDSSNVGSSPE